MSTRKRTYRLECGCLIERDSERYAKLCAEHQREYDATRQRWQAERAESSARRPAA